MILTPQQIRAMTGGGQKLSRRIVMGLLNSLRHSTWAETHPVAFKELLKLQEDMEGDVYGMLAAVMAAKIRERK